MSFASPDLKYGVADQVGPRRVGAILDLAADGEKLVVQGEDGAGAHACRHADQPLRQEHSVCHLHHQTSQPFPSTWGLRTAQHLTNQPYTIAHTLGQFRLSRCCCFHLEGLQRYWGTFDCQRDATFAELPPISARLCLYFLLSIISLMTCPLLWFNYSQSRSGGAFWVNGYNYALSQTQGVSVLIWNRN